MTINDVRKLFEEKKQTLDDHKKVEVLEGLLSDDGMFFKINTNTAKGILKYLGVKEEDFVKEYMELISKEAYEKSMPQVRVSVAREK